MTLIIVFGYVVASSPPVYRIVQAIAGIPKGPRSLFAKTLDYAAPVIPK